MKYAITMQVNNGYFDYTVNDFIMNKKPMEEFLRLKENDEYYNIAFNDICKKLNYTLENLNGLK